MASGTFPVFYIARMVIFFGLWYMFFVWIRKEILTQDEDGSTEHWYNARKFSAIFLVIFAVSSSMAAWDCVMSIDPHSYTTINACYIFPLLWLPLLPPLPFI